jgi:hypothetical protein
MTIEDSLERTLHRTAQDEETHLPESSHGIHATVAALRGLQAGFVATLIMTAFRLPIMRSLPPSANFWSTYVGSGEPEDYPVIGLLLHLLYGTVNGAVFGGLFALQSAERSVEPEGRGIVWGSIFGMCLSAFGSQMVLNGLLDSRLEADELTLFHAGHLVYGIALGAWVGSRTEGVEELETEYDYQSAK